MTQKNGPQYCISLNYHSKLGAQSNWIVRILVWGVNSWYLTNGIALFYMAWDKICFLKLIVFKVIFLWNHGVQLSSFGSLESLLDLQRSSSILYSRISWRYKKFTNNFSLKRRYVHCTDSPLSLLALIIHSATIP